MEEGKIKRNKQKEASLNVTLRQAKILVIDDSVDNIKILGSVLKKEGYEVLTANTSNSGLSIAQAKTPDIILLDVMMPEMNGYALCQKLKSNQRTAEIPVIFLTALTDETNIVKGFELGAVDYVSKPFNQLELLARIKNHLQVKLANEHTKALFESVYHTYITINKDLQIVNYNYIANVREELFGSGFLEVGQNIFEYIKQEDHNVFRRKIENVFKGKVSILERQYKLEEGSSWFNYIFEPIISSQGEIVGCLINGTDITDKKGFELRVQQYNHQLKEVYQESQQSLEFASYIQNAIFPVKKDISASIKDHFLIYKPKDFVSGDFYWMHSFGNKILFVMGDCTGHGVPGALLTTISVLLLERIVKFNAITSPDEILYEIDANLRDTFRNGDSKLEHGMEIAICLFDKKKRTVDFAGAKRSLYMVNNNEIHELKASRYDLGGNNEKIFKKHHVTFDEDTIFYLFSDGITDQMGGEHQKRFMKRNLINLIAYNCKEELNDQKATYEHALAEWMKNCSQTDDITMIGLKVI
jgi:PAS domain S-box-containing protein